MLQKGAKCGVVECHKLVMAAGFCAMHYKRWQRHGHLHDTRAADWGAREKHPLYTIHRDLIRRYTIPPMLCEAWVKDFWRFVQDVGEYPGPKYRLARLDPKLPYSPENCCWREKLVSKKDPEYLRKRSLYQKEHREKNMRKHHDRALKRHYGVGIDWYERVLAEQGNVCAVCRENEPSVDPRLGKYRRLAVDHCHSGGHARGILCSSCNRGIGLFRDNPDFLEAAAAYLRRHARSKLE